MLCHRPDRQAPGCLRVLAPGATNGGCCRGAVAYFDVSGAPNLPCQGCCRMTWTAEASSVWGKTDKDTGGWLPLVTHLTQAAAVAGLLWDHFIPRSVKNLLEGDLLVGDGDARALCCWFAGVHDVGKASVGFSQQANDVGMFTLTDAMRDQGLTGPTVPRAERVRHEAVSQLAVRDWLESEFAATRRVSRTWASVVGGHHGKNPTEAQLEVAEHRPNAVGVGLWATVRSEILDHMADLTGVLPLFPTLIQRRLTVRAQALCTGIVVLADWLASNQDYFPYHDTLTPEKRAAVALAALDLPEPWAPDLPTLTADELLRARFPDLTGAIVRPIQEALVGTARTCTGAPLLIVEAPMGEGKTEAALMAAEVLAARFGHGGLYVGLPTMATANPMFTRTLRWLSTALDETDASVALAHGKAGLNDDYAGLLSSAWKGQIYDDDDAEGGRPVVNGWLRGRRRAVLADFVVGTIDQGLFTALKAKYVVLRHLGLASKIVVVDEVHAADVYMREYLKRALSWWGAYETPVILMSATLPPAHRDEFVAAYASGRGDREVPKTDRADTYPRLTYYDEAGLRDVTVPAATKSSALAVKRMADDQAALQALLNDVLVDGGCAAVICNTVARAQQAFRQLKGTFGDDVVLLHSRFIAPDRALRERRLVGQLGPGAEARPHRLIVVGTQVLEQSLDVDFDVMITDLAPIDLMLQRVGRLHRHHRDNRPDAVAAPTLYVRGVQDWSESPPKAVRGSVVVYGDAVLLRAAAVLAGRDSITLPREIPSLVRAAYDPELSSPQGWESRWADAEKRATTGHAAAKGRAQAYLLDSPTQHSDLNGWIDLGVQDPDRSEEQGSSQVRDSEDSLEVIALWRDLAGLLHLPDCAPRHPGAVVPEGLEWGTGPEAALAREMATCTLSLPIQLTNAGAIEKVIAELERSVDASGWQQSPWLKGQLVLVFGPDGPPRLAGFELNYTTDEGLVVTRPEETP